MTLNKMSFKKKVKISIGGIFVLIIGSVATVVCKQILLQFNTLGVQAKLPKIEETLKAEKLKQTSLDLQSSLDAKAEKDAKIVPIMVDGWVDPYADPTSVPVYVISTGKKYHNHGCRYLNKDENSISLDDAIAKGLKPCSVCNAPSLKE